MRKWLVFVAAAACVVAFGSSASAAPPAATNRVPTDVPVFHYWYAGVPEWAGYWSVVDENGQLTDGSGAPLAPHEPFMVAALWVGQSYGHTMEVPSVDHYTLTVTNSDGAVVYAQTQAQGDAAWMPVFAWDDYWVNMLGRVPGFNPNMGNGTYGIEWNVTFANGLPTGVYQAVVHQEFTHIYNDLSAYSDVPARPTHLYPYSYDYPFTIAVS